MANNYVRQYTTFAKEDLVMIYDIEITAQMLNYQRVMSKSVSIKDQKYISLKVKTI